MLGKEDLIKLKNLPRNAKEIFDNLITKTNKQGNDIIVINSDLDIFKTKLENVEHDDLIKLKNLPENTQESLNNINIKTDKHENDINDINSDLTIIEKKVNDHIKNHPSGGDGEGTQHIISIDDSIISKDTTWSSFQIEEFVHNNTDAIWNTEQGEFLTIDYSKEGYLREIEILGKTWQDNGGNNIFDEELRQGDISAQNGQNIESNLRISSVNFISVGNAKVLYVYREKANGNFAFRCYNSNKNFIGVSTANRSNNSFSLNLLDGTCYVRFIDETNDLSNKYSIATSPINSYEPYRKADYSNVNHVGELYVDEKGQPILDNDGRKQYKIEIQSFNKNLFSNNPDDWELGSIHGGTGENYYSGNRLRTKKFIEIPPGSNLYWKNYNNNYNSIGIRIYNSDKKCIFGGGFLGGVGDKISVPDARYIRFIVGFNTGSISSSSDIKNFKVQFEIGSNATSYVIPKSYKTTLLLPCQLMKVGDISDRLYWDIESGRYVIEKNIGSEKMCEIANIGFSLIPGYDDRLVQGFRIYPCNKPSNVLKSTNNGIAIVKGLKPDMTINDEEGFSYGRPTPNYVDFRCKVTKSKMKSNDLTGLNDYLNKNNFVIFYPQIPQIIETNIRKELSVPCYKDKTFIYVSGGLNGMIRTKIPIDGANAIQSLSDKNISLNIECKELKKTIDEHSELLNTSLMVTDEIYTLLEPLLVNMYSEDKNSERLINLYLVLVQRGIKSIDDIPFIIREQVKKLIE